MNLDRLAGLNLDDTSRFAKVLDLGVLWAWSYADMQPGRTDREKREKYREAAAERGIIRPAADPLWWAFRITVEKSVRLLDIDNVAKLIVDAFCGWQIRRDNSPHTETELYPNDTLDYVRVLQVAGAPGSGDRTRIEVFACIAE